MSTPGDGHQFHLSVSSQLSSSVVGVPGHRDADWVGEPWTLTVRAWNLPAALRKAADVPLNEWTHPEHAELADERRATFVVAEDEASESDGSDLS